MAAPVDVPSDDQWHVKVGNEVKVLTLEQLDDLFRLEIIDSESDRLDELIRNLLDMSRLEAGVLRIDREPTDLAEVGRACMTRVQRHTDRHQLLMDWDTDHLADVDASNPPCRSIGEIVSKIAERSAETPAGTAPTPRPTTPARSSRER